MKSNLIAAAFLALGLITGGFLAGGRYAMNLVNERTVVRLDRWTGDVTMCIFGMDVKEACDWVDVPPPAPKVSN